MFDAGQSGPSIPDTMNGFSALSYAASRGGALDKKTRGTEKSWCCQTGLNCRPLHYQWSALPLSYGSMPRSLENRPKGPSERADPCHKPCAGASAGLVCNSAKTAGIRADRLRRGCIGLNSTPSGSMALFSARVAPVGRTVGRIGNCMRGARNTLYVPRRCVVDSALVRTGPR